MDNIMGPGSSGGKESACSAGDPDSIPMKRGNHYISYRY